MDLLRSMELSASTGLSFADCSMAFRAGTSGASSTGTGTVKKSRRRPQSSVRRTQQRSNEAAQTEIGQQLSSGQKESSCIKRKVEEVGEVSAKCVKRDQSRVDPLDPPTIQ
ncbi:unnamed protein product [Microthlaspi erraticum]|uniref:Uncharacterized protein n=1 Tax=Microthlaspi erraticum TaxID=1685480 RepID=A0A6D2J5Z7_9BRAS|nr:unnamed protein product [Microthlaspi erraticum]CAA7036230.1 unnamed protein product [Microthlaspi erraticum]